MQIAVGNKQGDLFVLIDKRAVYITQIEKRLESGGIILLITHREKREQVY